MENNYRKEAENLDQHVTPSIFEFSLRLSKLATTSFRRCKTRRQITLSGRRKKLEIHIVCGRNEKQTINKKLERDLTLQS